MKKVFWNHESWMAYLFVAPQLMGLPGSGRLAWSAVRNAKQHAMVTLLQ